jgi:hypothetical protein
LFLFVLCTICCQFLSIVPLLITTSVFSTIYLTKRQMICSHVEQFLNYIIIWDRNIGFLRVTPLSRMFHITTFLCYKL